MFRLVALLLTLSYSHVFDSMHIDVLSLLSLSLSLTHTHTHTHSHSGIAKVWLGVAEATPRVWFEPHALIFQS